MKCPKCGADNAQFISNTTGGGISTTRSCCGYIVFGPIGLLCGACGKGTTTKEFWICNSCGYRFSELEAKFEMIDEKQRIKDDEKYHQYAKEVAAVNMTYDSLLLKVKELNSKYDDVMEERRDYLKELCMSDDENIRKNAKKLCSNVSDTLICVLFVIGIISMFIAFPIGLILIIASIVWLLLRGNKEDRISKTLCQLDSKFKKIENNANQLKKEKSKYEELEKKARFVKDYEK